MSRTGPEDIDPTRIDIEFDPTVRRMIGVAYHGNKHFNVPFMSPIVDNLWTGGCQSGLILPEEIDHVVSLYPWEEYSASRPLHSKLAVRMYDSTDEAVNSEQVWQIAAWVNSCRSNGVTLVHCQAGLNRSNLIAAAALILDGVEPHEALALLREKRSHAVLCNPLFEEWVLNASPPRMIVHHD